MVDLKWDVPNTEEVEVDAETLADIDEGIRDVEEGRTYSNDEVRAITQQCLSEFATRNPR